MTVESLEAPYLLLAAPVLLDPNFARSVVLIGHHTNEGALGWIVNRVLERKAAALLPPPLCDDVHPDTPLRLGGPVLTNGLIVVHRQDVPGVDSIDMAPQIRVSASPAILPKLFSTFVEGATPEGLLLFGYSGWAPGQLEAEMEEGSWLVLPYEVSFGFPGHTDGLWEEALARLGVRPEAVSTPSGGVS